MLIFTVLRHKAKSHFHFTDVFTQDLETSPVDYPRSIHTSIMLYEQVKLVPRWAFML